MDARRDIEFIPDRLNEEPVVFLSMTNSEIKLSLMIFFAIWTPICLMVGWIIGKALLSLGLAVISAAPLWFVRNQLSDEAAFRTIRTYYHATNYVRADGNHAATVQTDLLPRLALEHAQQRGTVTALREFLAEFGGTAYGQAGRDAIHVHFERVKQAFLAQANMGDAQMVRLMSALIAWLEAHGSPPINVHYAPPGSAALLEVDRVLAASANRLNGRPIAPIAPHFAPQYAEQRERSVTRALQAGFGAVFPGEILELEFAPPAQGHLA